MPKSPKPSAPRAPVRLCCVTPLLLLALSVTACATRPPPPSELPRNPPPPALSEPLPSELYSTSAQRDMRRWRSELTATPPTSER